MISKHWLHSGIIFYALCLSHVREQRWLTRRRRRLSSIIAIRGKAQKQ